ncbi:hypothetical protein ACS0TY_024224 [Phlomoides rotata]
MGVVFYPDYIDYHGTHYVDSMVSFSRSYVEARSKAIFGGGDENFHIHLEIEDIVKIESQWSAQFETGTISIYFISKDALEDNIGIIHNASGLQELKFPAVDSNWYKKQEAIESLDVRYKALWKALLDTGTETCSALCAGEAGMLKRSYFPNFNRPFEDVIYPKGDPDAVSISKSDADLLLPDTFVNDTIIDFYIKYLRARQKVDERTKFHFFNSFFFRKLADMDRDPSSAFDGKAAFQRVRKWTRKVNLLEKDFIFIPVNYSYHWSLIVICYFGEVASYKDDGKSVRVPCVLHMDSLRGNHIGLKDLIQSYLWEEWKERQKGTCEDLYEKFKNLKFVPLELPQQQNSFDCGLFLLHYVELFLEQLPANFSIYKISSSSNFLQADWFPPGEASLKRTHIERLINDLLDTKSEDCPPHGGNDMHCSHGDLNTTRGYEEGLEFSVKSGPLSSYRESSLCHGLGIEMTLLPASSVRTTQCTRTSGLVFKELFKQGSSSEPFEDASWGAFESRASFNEYKRPVSLSEEEEEAGECFATELGGPGFSYLDGVNSETPAFPYSSEDFRSEPVDPPISDVDSSPVASGCDSGDIIVEADEKQECVKDVSLDGEHGVSQSLSEISGRNDDSIFLKNFSEEANELQNDAPICPAIASGDKLNDSKCESLPDSSILPSRYSPGSSRLCDGLVLDEWISESADEEQHTAKRMRITPTDREDELASNLSKDEPHL